MNSVVPLAEIVEELENGSRPQGGVDDSGDVFSVGGEHPSSAKVCDRA